jgi:hypothetical protein
LSKDPSFISKYGDLQIISNFTRKLTDQRDSSQLIRFKTIQQLLPRESRTAKSVSMIELKQFCFEDQGSTKAAFLVNLKRMYDKQPLSKDVLL